MLIFLVGIDILKKSESVPSDLKYRDIRIFPITTIRHLLKNRGRNFSSLLVHYHIPNLLDIKLSRLYSSNGRANDTSCPPPVRL